MTDYCTLAEAKAELKADTTIDDPKLRSYIHIASKRIDSIMGSTYRPMFAPYTEQRQFMIEPFRIDSYNNIFWLWQYLLSISAVLQGTTALTTVSELYPSAGQVAQALHLTDTGYTWYSSDTPPVSIKVTGTWGWHEDYANAYWSVDTLAAAVVSASATSITVVDVDGADLDGLTPRLSAGNLIQIDSELMEVTATATTTNICTVRRGVNGTTAALHNNGTAVKTYRVDERIKRACIRQATLLYARRGAYQVETLDGVGAITYPQDLLIELRGILQEFNYV